MDLSVNGKSGKKIETFSVCFNNVIDRMSDVHIVQVCVACETVRSQQTEANVASANSYSESIWRVCFGFDLCVVFLLAAAAVAGSSFACHAFFFFYIPWCWLNFVAVCYWLTTDGAKSVDLVSQNAQSGGRQFFQPWKKANDIDLVPFIML